jgi:hypothetical protein
MAWVFQIANRPWPSGWTKNCCSHDDDDDDTTILMGAIIHWIFCIFGDDLLVNVRLECSNELQNYASTDAASCVAADNPCGMLTEELLLHTIPVLQKNNKTGAPWCKEGLGLDS